MRGEHPVAQVSSALLSRGSATRRWLVHTARNLALQDAFMLAYHGYLWVLATSSARGPLAPSVRLQASWLLVLALGFVALTRGELLPRGPLRAFAYRAGMFGGMLAPYFLLRPLLQALEPRVLDAELLALDRALFGGTPAEWLDAFVSAQSVEWFSFFYYSYYALLALVLCGSLLFDTGRRCYELLLAAVIVICVGHIGYTWVPGVGPYAWPELAFEHALVGGPWWHRVKDAVSAAGAQLDIFPSLHTGLSLCVGLHVLRHRDRLPFSLVWPVTTFFVANIVVATVFLRWHYAVDLVAGAALAIVAQRVAIAAWRYESSREEYGGGRQPAWERLAPTTLDEEGARVVGWLMVICLSALVAALIASTAQS